MSDKGMAFMLAGLILGTFIALATGSVLVVSRWFPRLQMDPDSSDLGQMFAGAIGTMFALVFALVTIAVWGNYDRVSNGVGDEANCIHNIYRSLESYPPELRDPVQGLMRTYLKQVVQVEWPMMKEGREDPEARRLITEVNARISAYRPVALGELPLHQETLTLVSKYRGLRHDRIRASVAYLDACMWISLMMGSLILLGFCSLWRRASLKDHLLMSTALGASLGVVFYLMLAYNHPFQRPGAVEPAPLVDLLEHHWT